jgi:hypothetical protein
MVDTDGGLSSAGLVVGLVLGVAGAAGVALVTGGSLVVALGYGGGGGVVAGSLVGRLARANRGEPQYGVRVTGGGGVVGLAVGLAVGVVAGVSGGTLQTVAVGAAGGLCVGVAVGATLVSVAGRETAGASD